MGSELFLLSTGYRALRTRAKSEINFQQKNAHQQSKLDHWRTGMHLVSAAEEPLVFAFFHPLNFLAEFSDFATHGFDRGVFFL